MIKSFFASILLLACLSPTISSDQPDEKLLKQCYYPTVMISTAFSNGSAFVVRSDRVGDKYHNVAITCAHCVQHKGEYSISVGVYDESELVEYKVYPAHIYAANSDSDIAVVLFESDNSVPVAEMDFTTKYHISTKIFKFGFGMGDDCRLDRGEITSVNVHRPDVFAGHVRHNAYTIMGDSGGPVFLEKNYKVIAITRGIRSLRTQVLPHHAYAVPIDDLKTWGDEVNNALKFVYNRNRKMPVMPFRIIYLEQYQVQEPGETE